MDQALFALRGIAVEMGIPEDWLLRLTPAEQFNVLLIWNRILRLAPPAPGVPRVSRAARQFLTASRPELGHRSPRDLLAIGDLVSIKRLVEALRRHDIAV